MTDRNPIPDCLSHLEQMTRPALIRAWHAAKDSCLLPPDGGSPTESEVAVSVRAANAIRAMIAGTSLPELVSTAAEPAQTANPGCDTWYRESYVKQLEARPEWTAEKEAALEYLLGSVENIYLRLSLPLRADDTRSIARAAFPEKSDV